MGIFKSQNISKTGEGSAKAADTTVPEGYIPISSVSDFDKIREDLSGKYFLTTDIDMSGVQFDVIGQTANESFKGIFDGNGHTIRNLSIESDNAYVGLFGYINGGTVQNLIIEDISVKGTIEGTSSTLYMGALAGYVNAIIIDNVNIIGNNSVITNTENVKNYYIGGMIGNVDNNQSDKTKGNITNCSSIVNIRDVSVSSSTTSYIGGLIGNSKDTIINKSFSKSTIQSDSGVFVGGLIGNANHSAIADCYSNTNINVNTTKLNYVGGLIGFARNTNSFYGSGMTIKTSYSSGHIVVKKEGDQSDTNIGGLVGGTDGTNSSTALYRVGINNVYTTVNIDANLDISKGIVGSLIGDVKFLNMHSVYSIGNVNVESTNTGTLIGGLTGRVQSDIVEIMSKPYPTVDITKELSYWVPETTKIPVHNTTSGEHRTIQEMLYKNNYSDWKDFDTMWGMKPNKGSLPYLLSLGPNDEILEENIDYIKFEGEGTENNPFIIDNTDKFNILSSFSGKGYYKLANDIDASSLKDFYFVGTKGIPFTGVFDGNGCTIRNLSLEFEDIYVGMFGYISGGTVKNLTLDNVNVTSTYSKEILHVGGLAGYITEGAIIENVNITGNSVIIETENGNTSYVGGLVGFSGLDSVIKQSSTSGNVNTKATRLKYAGGLVGYISSSTIENSNSNVQVLNDSQSSTSCNLGGLIGGASKGIVSNCNSSGAIINNSTDIAQIFIGGLIGDVTGVSNITSSYSNSSIVSKSGGYIGGLLGRLSGGKVSECYSNADINLNTKHINYTGGLIGSVITSNVTIEKSYSKGNIVVVKSEGTTANYIGGLIGSSGAIARNVYSTVDIETSLGSTTSNIGSLIGYSTGNIINGYSVGKLNVDLKHSNTYIGGLVGKGTGTSTNSYWAMDITGVGVSAGASDNGRRIEEMFNKDNYTDWEFDTIWGIKENGESLPYLLCSGIIDEVLEDNFSYLTYKGSGTEQDPYIVETLEQLKEINLFNGSKYFKLANNIDASGVSDFYTIGRDGKNFSGKLDGDNNTISNLTINSNDDYVALFRENEGTIKNLKLSNITVNSNYAGATAYVGGLVADNKGIIQNVEIDGNINNVANVTNLHIGQIVGYNTGLVLDSKTNGVVNNTGTVINLFMGQVVGSNDNMVVKVHNTGTLKNTGTVTTAYIGGIVGKNNTYSLIKLCSNEGNIEVSEIATLKEGGIAGSSAKRILDSYSKGTVSISARTARIGGIVGENTGSVINTYSVDSIQKTVTSTTVLGGITGYNSGTGVVVTSSYWNIEGIEEQTGKGTLKTLEELQQQSTFENWDFDNIWSIGNGNISRTVGVTNSPVFNEKLENYFYNDGFWEWHSSYETTGTYKGEHIFIDRDKIGFYGYNSKDFLYKDNGENASNEKTFRFAIDETKANHTALDGAGLLFDANRVDDKLSGYVLLIRKDKICIYRLDNVDINEFEKTSGKTIEDYAGQPIASCDKTLISTSIHNLVVETSPTRVTVVDNGEQIFDVNLDSSKHAGGDYALITSYSKSTTGTSEVYFMLDEIDVGYTVPVYKVDEYNRPLPGVKFEIKNEADEVVKEGLTDEKGIFYIEDLEKGRYTLQEVQTIFGYALVTEIYDFNLATDGKAYDVNTNKEIKYFRIRNVPINFYFYVYDKDGNGIPGRHYYLYDSDGKIVCDSDGNPRVFTSDSTGKVYFDGIDSGRYTYKPAGGGNGYVPNGNGYGVTIDKDGTVTFDGNSNGNIIEDGIKGTVEIGNSGNVSDVIYGVYDKDGNPILDADGNPIKITTGEDGKCEVDLGPGDYTIKEESVPDGYKPGDNTIDVTVKGDGSVEYEGETGGIIEIEKIVGIIGIEHKDSETNGGISGSIFGVYDKDGNPVTDENGDPIKIITGEDGTGKIELEPGDYDIIPEEFPDGYEIDNNKIGVSVKEDGSVEYDGDTTISTIRKATVTIKKCEKNTTIGLQGAEIAIYDENGNPILDSEGNPIRLITDENGEVHVTLRSGTYKFQEITAPDGYVLNNTMYKFTVSSTGKVTFIANEDGINSEGIIYNERVYGEVTIYKYLINTTIGLEGAEIAIYDDKGNAILGSDGNPFTVITNANGVVRFRITPGTYQFQEIVAPDGYNINSTMYKFTVSNSGEVSFIVNADGVNSNGIIYNERKEGYGLVTIKKYETGTTNGLQGAEFGIYDEDGNPVLDKDGNHMIITTNENGDAQVSLEPGTYQFKEENAPYGYKKDDTMYKFVVAKDGSVQFVENADGVNSEGIIYNERVYGEVIIYKYLINTTIGLEGAQIAIYDDKGNAILDSDGNPFRVTTNANGIVKFKITPGTYQFQEVTAPDGYEINGTMYKFTVSNSGEVSFVVNADGVNSNGIIYDERKEGYGLVTIKKYETGTTIGLEGAVIKIYDENGREILDDDGKPLKLTTNAEGNAQISLEPGIYHFREIQAPAGYKINNTMYKFVVNDDGSVEFVANADGINSNGIIYNEKIEVFGNVVIIKREKGTEIGLKGAVIGIYDENGNPILDSDGNPARFTTDDNGRIEFQITSGIYQFKEEVAPDGYILNDIMYKFKVSENGTVTFIDNVDGVNSNGIIYNERVYGEVIIYKYLTGTTIGIEGAVIGIYDENGNAILDSAGKPLQFETDENGQVKFQILPGTYQFKEVVAPAGYILNDTLYKFTVSNNGVVTFVPNVDGINSNGIIYNDKIEGFAQVIIKKYEKDTNIGLAGAIIGIYDEDGNPLKDNDGNIIKLETNENGKVQIALPIGIYQFKEIKAPYGYDLNDTMYKFEISKDGTVTFIDNNGIIYNELLEGYTHIILKKYEKDTTKGLAGAIIGIYDNSGNPILDEQQKPIKLTTDQNGEVKLILGPGTYQYKEEKAPDGYVLNDTVYRFVISEDGIVTFIDNTHGIIYNEKVKVYGHVLIKKYEKDTTIGLAGAVIGIYDEQGNPIIDSDGNAVQLTTDSNGEVQIELEAGTYQYKEEKAPDGYKLNDTFYKFTVTETGDVIFEDNTHGIIYNEKIYGYIVLKKYEKDTTKGLQGAVIAIYDENGNPVLDGDGNPFTVTTNADGETRFALVPGVYQYKEIKAPNGYILQDIVYKFVVSENGDVTFVENADGVNLNGIIYNEKMDIYVPVLIRKYETGTSKGLQGAVIGIYDQNGNELLDDEGNAIKLTTDVNGEAKIELGVGIYQYKEEKAPSGYKLNDVMYKFTVTEAGEVVFENDTHGIIYNDKIKDETPDPDDNNVVEPDNNTVVDDNTTGNNITIPSENKTNSVNTSKNSVIVNSSSDIKQGKLPYSGARMPVIVVAIIVVLGGIYYDLKLRKKMDD